MSLLELNEGDICNAALAYAERGWPVLPLKPQDKVPAGNLVKTGLKEASTDQITILQWWLKEPKANVAIRTGVAFDVLDLDGPEALDSIKQLAPGYKHTGPVSTTGKGYHLLFIPTGARNSAKKLPGIDFRGENGYIVAPPSVHPNGNLYQWMRDGELPEPTDWLDQLVTPAKREGTTKGIDPADLENIVYIFMDLLGSIRKLETMGSRFRTNCIFPDHQDDTPSFVLYPDSQSFFCFGCGEWGDTLDLKRSYQNGLAAPSSWRAAA